MVDRPADGRAGYCSHCEREMPDGPDVCIGELPRVAEACCGHGWTAQPYVVLQNGQRLDARRAIGWFTASGVGPPPVETVTVRLFEQYDGAIAATAIYDYESLDLVSVGWTNTAEAEPVWRFDDITVRLVHGDGVVPLPEGLVCSENPDGTVALPIGTMETMPDGG